MTLAAHTNSDDDASRRPDGDDSGTALETSHGPSGDERPLAPFLAAAGTSAGGAPAARPFVTRLLDYSAHAAMIVGLLGFAWTISEHVGHRQPDPAPAPTKVVDLPATPAVDEAAELRRTTQKMAADISALRLSLDALRTAVRQDKTTDQVRSLSASVESVKSGLSATKTETSAALAQLSGKIDHLPHAETAAKLQQIADRLDKMERANADPMTTASLAPAPAASPGVKATPVALPPVKPPSLAKPPVAVEVEAAKKPPVLPDWVVRDVYDGVAVVEGKRGPMEVVPGVAIPGAGVVKSIDRHGAGWTVTTSKGQLAYVPPPRDRGVPRDYYRPGPEDF